MAGTGAGAATGAATDRRASVRERVLAGLALALFAILVAVVAVTVVSNLGATALALVGLPVLVYGGWWVVTERLPRRAIGAVATAGGVALLAGAANAAIDSVAELGRWAVAVIGLGAGSMVVARLALVTVIHDRDILATAQRFRPKRPVLICNPKSGGGKTQSTGLIERARSMGIEVLILEAGSDLEQMARDAVAAGADCIGMAGGDGSQALVASVAIEHGLPFVCISAGTRNHFALDLGLDRTDPVKGLRAYRSGVLRAVDYATVGDRVFLNNASLGVYAEMVDNEEYRGAKLATASQEVAQAIGADGAPYDLTFATPDGEQVEDALVILVSNNPYVVGPALDMSQRRSLTTGQLGVVALTARSGVAAAGLMLRSVLGRISADPNVHDFTAPTFTVESIDDHVNIGLDGEAMTLAPPLRFQIHPLGLQVLVPDDSVFAATARQYRSLGLGGLVTIARGNVPRVRLPTKAGRFHRRSH